VEAASDNLGDAGNEKLAKIGHALGWIFCIMTVDFMGRGWFTSKFSNRPISLSFVPRLRSDPPTVTLGGYFFVFFLEKVLYNPFVRDSVPL